MAPTAIDDDYYEILKITQTADEATIKASYKQLARLRHPDKNPNNPNATADFQRLNAAHSTLIDVQKRREYDILYPSIRLRRKGTSHHDDPFPSRGPTQPAGTTPQPGRTANAQPADNEALKSKKRVEELEKTHQGLSNKKKGLFSVLSEARRTMEKSRDALRKIEEEEAKDKQEQAARNGWYSYMFGKRETPEEKEVRERRATERRTGRLVRQAEFDKRKAYYDMFDSQMTQAEKEMAEVTAKIAEEKRREKARLDEIKRAEERRQWEKQEAERRQREAKERKAREEAQRKAREEMQKRAREEEIKRKAEEETRRKANEEMMRKYRERMEKEQREQDARKARAREQERTRRAEEKRREEKRREEERERLYEALNTGRERFANSSTRSPFATSSCLHRSWWDKVEGGRICEHCHDSTTRFAFQCPGCSMIACADCRTTLKGKGGGRSSKRPSHTTTKTKTTTYEPYDYNDYWD